MNSENKEYDIYLNINPNYILSKAIGLFPLSFFHKNVYYLKLKNTLEITSYDYLYVIIIMMLILGITSFLFISTAIYDLKDIFSEAILFQIAVNVISALVTFYLAVTKLPKEIREVLHRLSEIDFVLNIQKDFYETNSKLVRNKMITFICAYIFLFILDLYDMIRGIMYVIFVSMMDYIILIQFVTVMQFATLVNFMKDRLQILNDCIESCNIWNQNSSENVKLCQKLGIIKVRNNTQSTKTSAIFERRIIQIKDSGNSLINQQKMHISFYRIVHESLCDISSTINTIYGLQLLLFTISVFVEITINLNIQIISLTNNAGFIQKMIQVLFAFAWTVFHISMLFVMAGSCHSIKGEANQSIVILQRMLLIQELPPDVSAEVQLFLQQVINRKFIFTAWSFFDIDYKIFGSVVGAVTTLLVIFIQFNMQSN
ncbi:hypothetical protein L9F63_009816 [Diploptera punctata]|uniref:Gustatory receptor n=1 Tax=Diploptera punctata TaxID=6984 RepID=A0AAD8AIV8_DIPPU|nr:hypothetical protein L9F63_009816 [Diploptera punctata]